MRNVFVALLFLLLAGSFIGCAEKNPATATPELAVVRIESRSAGHEAFTRGRGFLVSPDGLIITRLNLVHGAQDITVTRLNGDKLLAEVVQGDDASDLAIIRVHAGALPYLKLNTDELEPGIHARIIATAGAEHAVFDHWEDFGNEMAISAPLSPIDSGSPVLGDDGRVIGIARADMKDHPTQSTATPIFRVAQMMPSLAKQPWLMRD